MGHGPSRELSGGEEREIPRPSDELVAKLDGALNTLDRLDPRFKSQRDDEKFSQMSKAWHRLGAEMDADLRIIAKALIASHQISLDVGSEGGGPKARPFVEETGGALERLYFALNDGKVTASVGQKPLGTVTIDQVNYAWLERTVVDWIVTAVELRGKTLPPKG